MADFVLHIQKLSKLRFPLDYKFDSADKKLQGIKKSHEMFLHGSDRIQNDMLRWHGLNVY